MKGTVRSTAIVIVLSILTQEMRKYFEHFLRLWLRRYLAFLQENLYLIHIGRLQKDPLAIPTTSMNKKIKNHCNVRRINFLSSWAFLYVRSLVYDIVCGGV